MSLNRPMKVLVCGSTGLIGTEVVNQLLDEHKIEKVTTLSRSWLNRKHEKLDEYQTDFDAFDVNAFAVDAVICALGTTMRKAKTKENFREVDYDYPLRIAKEGVQQGVEHFLLVSSLGADPHSKIFYNQVKGEIEQAIIKLNYKKITIVRPSLLLGNRKEFRLAESIAKIFAPFITGRYKPIHASKVAATLLRELWRDESGLKILESAEMQT